MFQLDNFRWKCGGTKCSTIFQLHPTNRIGDTITCGDCGSVYKVLDIEKTTAIIMCLMFNGKLSGKDVERVKITADKIKHAMNEVVAERDRIPGFDFSDWLEK